MNISLNHPFNETPLTVLLPTSTKVMKQGAFKNGGLISAEELSAFPPIGSYMGVEIELENVTLNHDFANHASEGVISPIHPATVVFSMKEDGSLRNNGWEFVSKVGFTGQEILWGVDKLLNSGAKTSIGTNLSTCYRTSLHVHLNVLDLTVEQYKKLLLWYLVLEPLFFTISGNRDRNIFCMPTIGSELDVYRLLRSRDAESFYRSIKGWTKYSAFNLLPTVTLGTVEFRHHAGTASYDTIEQWLVFLWQFYVEATSKISPLDSDLESIIKAHSDGNLHKLIGDRFGFYVESTRQFDEHINAVMLSLISRFDLINEEFEDITSESKAKQKKKAPKKTSNFDLNAFLDAPVTAYSPHHYQDTHTGGFTISTTSPDESNAQHPEDGLNTVHF